MANRSETVSQNTYHKTQTYKPKNLLSYHRNHETQVIESKRHSAELDEVQEKESEDSHEHEACALDDNTPKQQPAQIFGKNKKKMTKNQEGVYK